MKLAPKSLLELLKHGFDAVIDVRSPAEFAEDHLPGAISLPVLDNDERARVGTIYKQESPFKARKLGAALVFKNAAQHVAGPLAQHDGSWRPLVYCWRGGQRSGTFAWMLQEIGWRAEVVEGGYRTYRRMVSAYLHDIALPFKVLQLGGYTGTAKTALLPRLAERGVQVIDLEGLARHRGSLLGDMPGGQPAQKAFESGLAQALVQLDSTRPVLVEAESAKIGAINLPPSLWDAMKSAPWIEVTAPLEARAAYLSDAYLDVLQDADAFADKVHPLRVHRGHDMVDHWCRLSRDRAFVPLCESLAADHYDPSYRRAMRAMAPRVLAEVHTTALSETALDDLADRLAETINGLHLTDI